jgi:hypothetical protein
MGQRRLPEFGAYADASSEAARAGERMHQADERPGRAPSPRTRRMVGWAIVLIVLLFLVAAFAGWIDIIPGPGTR